MEQKKWDIVVAEDLKIVCMALGLLLEQVPNVNHVYLSYNGEEALSILNKHPVDLALLDVRMPVMDGLQAAKVILKDYPAMKVIYMTAFGQVATILDMFRTGVHGILQKELTDYTHLTNAINEVMKGNTYLSEEVRKVVESNRGQLMEPSRTRFTQREFDVLRFTSQGDAAKEIAHKLGITVGTVENYRKEMLHKTKTKNMAELVSFAIGNGIL